MFSSGISQAVLALAVTRVTTWWHTDERRKSVLPGLRATFFAVDELVKLFTLLPGSESSASPLEAARADIGWLRL